MRTHDLLRLKPGALVADDSTPRWVAAAIARAPWVVVRRAEIRDDAIPIGVRGATRAQRHATSITSADIEQTLTPEALARTQGWCRHARGALPALRALETVAAATQRANLSWGPVGSVGFELASGAPVVQPQSDLDIVIRPASHHRRDDLDALARAVDALDVRVDIVIESRDGGASLIEWLQSPQRVLIKTPQGARLGALCW